ncbi:MAG: UDP-N-acetylmuramoyl-tripeptide--D-alanyl-D-alanine ligase [Cyclobacteriaceae bacterium]|nr:UDP-N-acetylmuramoyl-tripeptide--D-alanyl-D-alanine ligase [Cyclobacteriaceae bacterium]
MQTERLYEKFIETGKISTDTRQISEGSIFFALRGDKFNANQFAIQALEKGARYAVVDEPEYANDPRCLLVDDVLTALQDLARHHRKQLSIPVIGLTGSNGKTTSKELLSAVLSKQFIVYATRGNLNNHIGVPLSVLSITPQTEIAVIEMGANHVGEIALLCSIAKPTHGFITNIGKAHIGTFGGFENIIRGKSELYQHLIVNKGTVFINSQNPILANMAKRFSEPYFYSSPGDYYSARLLDAEPFIRFEAENTELVQTHLLGAYNFENILAALCIGKFFGVSAKEANQAIAGYVPGNMRSQIIKTKSNTIILDAYNANPSSMEAAINNLAAMKTVRKVAILGDMFELEEEAEAEHAKIGELLLKKNFDGVFLCGGLMSTASKVYPQAKYFETKQALLEFVKSNPINDATILIKASRGIGLESVVEHL